MRRTAIGRKQPIALLLNGLPLLSAKQPFKKQQIKGYELLLSANSGWSETSTDCEEKSDSRKDATSNMP